MDFIIGILLVIILLFGIINFTSISITDNRYQQGQPQNFLYSSNRYNYNSPSPINANAPLALNKKLNLEEQSYDYKKHFFV